MTVTGSSAWLDSRIERALLWLVRIILAILALSALLRSDYRDSLVLAGVLVAHVVAYYVISRLGAGWLSRLALEDVPRRWLATLVDLALAGSAFYLTGGSEGPAGILGFVWAAAVAARLSLWSSMVANLILWFLFTFSFLESWIRLQQSFVPVLGNFFTYLAVTLAVNYLVSMESRQMRVGRDASRRLQQLATVHEVGRTISSTLELEDVLRLVMDKAVEILGAEAGSLLLLEDTGEQPAEQQSGALVFRVVLAADSTRSAADRLVGRRLMAGEGVAGAVLESGDAQLIDRVDPDSTWGSAPDLDLGLEVHSVLAVPLVTLGRVFGVLEVVNKRQGTAFGEQDLGLLSTYAAQAAVALENARLYKETHRRLQQVNTLYEVSRSLATLDTGRVLAAVAEQTVAALGADLCGVFLNETDRSGKEWAVLKALHDPEGIATHLVEARFDLEEHPRLRGLVGESGYVTFESVEAGEATALDDELRAALMVLGACSCLFVGLYLHDRPAGFILAANRSKRPSYSPDEIELCQALARHAIVAVENARLYESTDEALSRRLQELATIEEIDHELGTSLDYDHIIDLVLERAVQATGAVSGVIGLLTDEGTKEHPGRLETRHWQVVEGDASALTSGEWPVEQGIIGRVVQSGQPFLVEDVAVLTDAAALTDARARSGLAVPIKRDERVIGVLNLESDRPAAFGPEDLRFVEHLAEHAGIAIENARLFREEQRRAAGLATLNRVSALVTSELDPDRVLGTIVDSVIDVAGCQKAAIFVLEGNRVSLRMSRGLSEQYVAEAQEIQVTPEGRAQAILSDEPLVVTDLLTDPRLAAFVDLAQREGFRAVADVPLRGREANLGELTVYYSEPHFFTAVELDTLNAFANQAAIALENARLFQKERRRVQTLSAIGEIGREMRVSLDLDRTLNLILARIRDLVDYYLAEICLWDEDRQLLVTYASAGDPRYTARTGGIYHLDEGFSGWIARNQETLLLPDITTRADVRPKIVAADAPIRAYVGLPLRTGEAFIGTLELAGDQVGAYDESHLEILSIIADQAAVAIQGARLYAETQRRFEQTQLLLRVSESIRSSLDLTETVRLVAREMCRALDADMAGVYLPDKEEEYLHPAAGYHVPKDKLASYQTFRIPLKDSRFIQEAWTTRRPVYSLDPLHDPRVDAAIMEVFANAAILFAPMVARDRVMGGVSLVWHEERGEFGEDELDLANAIASQAGAVVESSRLFDAQQQRVRELGILFETSAAVSSSLALDEVLRSVALQMARALEVSSCSISDWDPVREVVTTLADEAAHPDLIDATMKGDIGESYSVADYPATAEALRQRRPRVIQVGEPGADQAERELLDRFGQKSLLMIPMVARDRVVGLVELYEHRHMREFTDDDVRLGIALANQAAIAIENARLYEHTDERLQARVDELTALQRITDELNATLELDRILDIVLETALETTGASHGNVLLVDMDSDSWIEDPRLTLRTAQGYSEEEQANIEAMLLAPSDDGQDSPGGTGESLVAQVAQSGEARIVDDAWQEPCRVCVKESTRSALIVPVFYEGLVVGLINVRHARPGAFDRQDLSFVQSLAQQAAVALGNAMRFEEQVRANTSLRDRTEQMARLLEVSRKLRTDVSLEETLEEVAYAIQETVGFNLVLISIVEGAPGGGGRLMRRVAAAGLSLRQFEELSSVQQPAERYEALFREEYELGAAYFFPWQKRGDWEASLHTVTAMAGFEGEWQQGQWHPRDMLLIPLRGAGGRLLGHISVDDPRDGLRPSRRTIDVLTVFANQAAIAVENAGLYADAQRRADNLALINEVGRSLTQVLDPQLVVDTVVQAIIDLLGCQYSAVFQVDRLQGDLAAIASRGVDLAEMGELRFAHGEGLVGRVAETCRPLLIPDTSEEPLFVAGPAPIGSMLLAPVMAGRQLMGVITAGSVRPYALSEADQVLMTTLADQLAVALESSRLFDSTQQAAVRISLLNEIGRRAAAQLEAREMLETTVDALHRNLEYFRIAVLLVNEAGTELSVAAANESFWPVIPAGFRQRVGEGLIGRAVSTGEPVLVGDTSADERYAAVGDWQCLSSLSVPIKLGAEGGRLKVIGVLHAEGDRRMAFAEEDVAALSIAADQLAVAIQNAHLFQETQRRVAELATINEIGRAISRALDATELYELIYNQVSKLLDTRNFHIALYEPESDLIRVEFLVEHGQVQPPVVLQLDQGLTSHLVRHGEPILLTHGSEEFLEEHGLSLEREPARSWLGVPMIAEDQVIGAIAVQSFDQDDAFDVGHLELLRTISGQAAIAFQNARLFEQRERRIGELAVLNEMAQAISSTLELDALLDLVYKQVSRLMDSTNFFIALYDEQADEITFPFVVDPEGREDWGPRKGGTGLTGRVIQAARPLLLPEGARGIYRESGQGKGPASATGGVAAPGKVQSGLCACWLGVPMIAEDKVLGIIAVQSYTQENLYDQEDLNFLTTVASQSAMAVRNAQLYEQIVGFSSELEEMVEARTHDLEKALDELTVERDRVETLYRITSELGASLELERVLQRALQLFADSLGIEHGTILLVDPETGDLRLRATLEKDRKLPREGKATRWKQGEGLAGWVLQEREPALISDIAEDARWVQRPDKPVHVRSVVAAPLSLGGGDILGVLTLGHPRVGYFGPEHVQLLTAATAQIAIAVNNSDLYTFITDQADQLGSALQSQREEAAKNRAILESIADGVLVLDHNGRVLLVNPAAEELLGFSALALEGQHFRHMLGLGETLIHREMAQALYTELRQRLEADAATASLTESTASLTVRLEAGNKVLAVNIAPLIVSLGAAPGVVAALRDISREAEVERLKNEFISTVSHELRTPMTSIKGYTDLLFLGMAGGLTDAQRNFLQIIKSNADRLTALVNDILDISRIETGRIRLTIEALDLVGVIGDVVASFEEQYRDKSMALVWKKPADLPQVRGDATRATQVLSNLLANAWHYTPEGGQVTISVKRTDGFVQVDVADTGIGISPEDVSRIFDRFYRADHPVVQEAGGTGLGLSIVKMFVEMLGGEIWVESEVGIGSTFSFTLPLSSTEVPEPSVELLTTEPAAAISRRPKILVVEDDRDLALLLRRQLESDGYQVLLAGSGEDALWLAREEQPQLITLDIMLPDMDGFVVLERLKAHPVTAPIPVIVASVLVEPETGYSLGAVDYVVKPFAEEKLLQAIRHALSSLKGLGAEAHEDQGDWAEAKVLVVDDDPDILALLEEALSFHGYEVLAAENGHEALDQVARYSPDLILLDLKMPGIDGYEVIRRLKADESTRHIPVIVITASPVDKQRDRVRVMGMGATEYVTKPLSIEFLIDEIKQAMSESATPAAPEAEGDGTDEEDPAGRNATAEDSAADLSAGENRSK